MITWIIVWIICFESALIYIHAACQTYFVASPGPATGICGSGGQDCQGKTACCSTPADCIITCAENGCSGTTFDCGSSINCIINCHSPNSCAGITIQAQNAKTLTVSTDTAQTNNNALQSGIIYCPDNGLSGGNKTCIIDCGDCADDYECANTQVYAREGFNDLLLISSHSRCFEEYMGWDIKCGANFEQTCKADWQSPNWECRSPDNYCDTYLIPVPSTSPTEMPSISPTDSTTHPSSTPTTTPTTNEPTTNEPTTASPTTSAPTPEQCIIFQNDSMDSVGEWSKISGLDIEIETAGSPRCADSNRCWRTRDNSFYGRTFSTSRYQDIALTFNYYSLGLDTVSPYEYCRIMYSFTDETNAVVLWEDDGLESMHNFGYNVLKLPLELNNVWNFQLYIESTAGGGTNGDEYCFFDNFEFCGFFATNSPTTHVPTNLPTTDSPTTNSPTTNSPTTKSPTTDSPITDSPSTYSPSTYSPSTDGPTTGAEGEQSGSTTEFDHTSDKYQSQTKDYDMVLFTVIIVITSIAIVCLIILTIGLLCCYRNRNRSNSRNKQKVDEENKMEMVEVDAHAALTRVSSMSAMSAANSDCDVINDMNVDIVSIVNTQTTKMNGGEDEGTDDELLYEGNENHDQNMTIPMTAGDDHDTLGGVIKVTTQHPEFVNDENGNESNDEIYNNGMYEDGDKSHKTKDGSNDDDMYLKGNSTKTQGVGIDISDDANNTK